MSINKKLFIYNYSSVAFVLIFTSIFGITLSGYSFEPFVAPELVPDDRTPVPLPEFRSAENDLADSFDKQFIVQGDQMLDFPRTLTKISGRPRQALNADAFGEVRNSSWFTNRNAFTHMTLAEIAQGPGIYSGPDTSAAWQIVRAKAEGVTIGFHIIDSRGDKYVIKFDPIGYAGLNSGAEVVCTKLYYAAGFNVPENTTVYFRPEILVLGEKVKFTDKKGRKRYMNQQDFEEIMLRVEISPNGLIQAAASKYIEGKLLGPFHFDGVREDDPNDFIPHEHRREVRGLKIIGIWLNNIDAKSNNSMDTYIGEDGEGFVRHYMMDFGSNLGSGSKGPQPQYRGHENEFDPHEALFKIGTLGLWIRSWEKPDSVHFPTVGRFSADLLEPDKFKFIIPNTAYDNCTDLDAYWGTKLVMSFTEDQIETAVAAGPYSAEAGKYLTKVLIERRDVIGKHWFGRVNPLDNFEISKNQDATVLNFTDLAVSTGLEDKSGSKYHYEIRSIDNQKIESGVLENNNLSLASIMKLKERGGVQYEITFRIKRESQKKLSKWVKVYLELDKSSTMPVLVGLKRQE
ncbi:MAG: hypothetical protein P9L92_15810 [Candidatus Electryonea clarkiae]|nr:hypothetical protein [Candidatus Electryonea clarkiae]MDP8285776.1 hypothetical protein [Candidatus Electryonea clarkiae]